MEHIELTLYTVCVQMMSFLYLPQPNKTQNRETNTGKTGPTVKLINDNRCIKINDHSFVVCSLLIGCATEINEHFGEKYCSCVIGERGEQVTMQRRGVILDTESKKLGNAAINLLHLPMPKKQ